MINVEAEIRFFLAAQPTLDAVIGSRLWAAADVPIVDYNPSQGPAICFKVRGGQIQTEQRVILATSVQFKCYGSDEMEANRCYRALYDVLDQGHGATMRWALAENPGQLLQEPERDKQWWFKLGYFTCYLDNS